MITKERWEQRRNIRRYDNQLNRILRGWRWGWVNLELVGDWGNRGKEGRLNEAATTNIAYLLDYHYLRQNRVLNPG
jgi:hypothetical protein